MESSLCSNGTSMHLIVVVWTHCSVSASVIIDVNYLCCDDAFCWENSDERHVLIFVPTPGCW